MWNNGSAWLALGVSLLFVVVGLLMHRVFIRILKSGATEPDQENKHE